MYDNNSVSCYNPCSKLACLACKIMIRFPKNDGTWLYVISFVF
jgi:hypothetical protein